MKSRTTIEIGLALSLGIFSTGCGLSPDGNVATDDNALETGVGRLAANSVTITDFDGDPVPTSLGPNGEPLLSNIQLDYEVTPKVINDTALEFDVRVVSAAALPNDVYFNVIMNDVFSAQASSAVARDVTIDLSEAIAGTPLECEQGGAYQATPWSSATVELTRIDYDEDGKLDGDKLSIETVFHVQLSINTGSGCQPGAYRVISKGTVFFDKPILVNNNFEQQRTGCTLDGNACHANRPACLADAFGAANEQGVITNPNTEYARRNFFAMDPQCWEPAGLFQSCGAMAEAGVPKDIFGRNKPHELHCVFDDQAPFIEDYSTTGWTRLDGPGTRTYDCQACFYRLLP